MNRPEFETTIAALRCTDPRFPWIYPTQEEAEIADTLAELAALHQPSSSERDERGNWGRCTGCHDPWPCEAWQLGTELAVRWLGRGADRYYAHAKTAMTRGSAA